MRTLAASLLLALTLVSGCMSAPPQHDPYATEYPLYDQIERAIGSPIEVTHDHAQASLHESHYNLDLVARVKGEAGRVPQPGEAYLETAVKDGYAYLCRTGPEEGLVIFDVHDIEHPKYLSTIRLDAGFEADIEVSDDGHWAFWETQRLPGEGVPDPTNPTSIPGITPYGIHVIDISDKAAPQWVSFTPIPPNGPHSITYANITGRHVVFASTYAWSYVGGPAGQPRLAPPMLQREVILELDTSKPVPVLTQVAEYSDPAAAEASPVMPDGGRFPHDVSVAVHPITQKTYAYVAYWNLGIDILDVSDPAKPVKVGQATDFGPASYRNVHMARQGDAVIAGKVILVAEPEIGGEPDSGYMTFFDATDPVRPTYLSSWRIPGNITSDGGNLGPHYFDFKGGRVAMASYHAGYWVIDVHDAPNLLRPRTVAFAQSNATGTGGTLDLFGGAPNAFDAWWADATHILVGDVHGGLEVFRYTGPAPRLDIPAA
ncbi:MAG: hypothetical protein V4510_00645 [bacterium]